MGKSGEDACFVDAELGSGHMLKLKHPSENNQHVLGDKGLSDRAKQIRGRQEEPTEEWLEVGVVREKAPGECARHQTHGNFKKRCRL